MTYDEALEFYDALIAQHKDIERKGKTMPYTSANGYMFTLLNKAGEIGFRFSKQDCAKFKEEHDTTEFRSYGAVMRDYALIPESMYKNKKQLLKYLDKSYKHVLSLPPNKGKKK